jgi:hypothetical protein
MNGQKKLPIRMIDYLRKRSSMDHNKKRMRVLFLINVVFVLIFLASLVIPSKGKEVYLSNIDISAYNELESIPVIGTITDNRKAEIEFHLDGETLYGISLYFYVTGNETALVTDEAKVKATIRSESEVIAETEVTVRELYMLMSDDSLNEKELVFDCEEPLEGTYTLVLEGEGIPAETRISLYGNKSTDRDLNYRNAGLDRQHGVLYSLEITTREHPFIWSCGLMLAMCFLFSCIIENKWNMSKTVEE